MFGFLARPVLLALLLACTLPALAQVDVTPFTKLDTFTSIKLSPTGEYLAATVPRGDSTGLVVLRRANNAVTASVGLGKNTHVSDFEWVNDGRLVLAMAEAFGSDDEPTPTGELFGVDADGKNLELLVGFRAVASNSASRIKGRTEERAAAYLVDTLPEEEHAILISVWPFHDDPYTRLERMDVRSGKRSTIARSPVQRGWFTVDHDRRVRMVRGLGEGNASMLYHRANDDAEWVLVNNENETGRVERPVGFARDNRIVYLVSHTDDGPSEVVAYDTQTGERKPMLRHPVVDPARIVYSLGERKVPVGAAFLGDQPALAFFDEASPEAVLHKMLQRAFAGHDVQVTSGTRDGKLVLVQTSSPTNPGDFYLFNVDTKEAAYLLSRRTWIDPDQMAEVRAVSLKARDGLALHGYLTMPRGAAAGKLPMVVNVHGGPFGVFHGPWFDAQAQMLARAGYAVLQVNYRGSGNYGRAFQVAGAQEWGRAMQDDITDATRWAIAQGIADPERICLLGGSYGAYSALMGVVREPDLYACAVGSFGVYDLDLMVKEDSRGSRFLSNFSSQWVGEAGTLAQVSPSRLADRIKAPVFLAAGEEDQVAPFEHTRMMEQALRKAGVPVETLYYRNEGHGFYVEAHQIEYRRRLLDFLAGHLGGSKAN
jgi:dipeptidyl aminopeptidase/acylaminoacyl peptidase